MTATLTPDAVSKLKRTKLIDRLCEVEGKAEIIHGKVVRMSPVAPWHGHASNRVLISLADYEEKVGGGHAFGDNIGFLCELPYRDSFSPDAAWQAGSFPKLKGSFYECAPTFAVEVRSLRQYGPRAESKILKKIREYFEAGTKVVWDVDNLREGFVRKYTPETIDNPRVFKRGEIADAEPAVPGWRLPVDKLFIDTHASPLPKS